MQIPISALVSMTLGHLALSAVLPDPYANINAKAVDLEPVPGLVIHERRLETRQQRGRVFGKLRYPPKDPRSPNKSPLWSIYRTMLTITDDKMQSALPSISKETALSPNRFSSRAVCHPFPSFTPLLILFHFKTSLCRSYLSMCTRRSEGCASAYYLPQSHSQSSRWVLGPAQLHRAGSGVQVYLVRVSASSSSSSSTKSTPFPNPLPSDCILIFRAHYWGLRPRLVVHIDTRMKIWRFRSNNNCQQNQGQLEDIRFPGIRDLRSVGWNDRAASLGCFPG